MPRRGSGCPGGLGPPRVPQVGPVSRCARPHSLDLQRGGLNLHLHLVGGAREQFDGAVLAEALPVHLVEDRAVVRLDAQRDGEAHKARQVPHGWAREGGRGGSGGAEDCAGCDPAARARWAERKRAEGEGGGGERLRLGARAVAAVSPGFRGAAPEDVTPRPPWRGSAPQGQLRSPELHHPPLPVPRPPRTKGLAPARRPRAAQRSWVGES